MTILDPVFFLSPVEDDRDVEADLRAMSVLIDAFAYVEVPVRGLPWGEYEYEMGALGVLSALDDAMEAFTALKVGTA